VKLDDRMKMYEKEFTSQQCKPGTMPVIARMDGRHFHSFCKGLEKPFDGDFVFRMQYVTEQLVEETNCDVAYCQSDEITLLWLNDNKEKQIYFGGKLFKMISSLAAFTTAEFNFAKPDTRSVKRGTFDARVWQVPSIEEACNALLWREEDASRNSISMLAQHSFSHNQLHGVNTRGMLDMLSDKGIEWSSCPNEYRFGTHFKRVTTLEPFTIEELEDLPPMHNAHKNPDLEVERHYVEKFHVTEQLSSKERIALLFGEDRVK